MCTELEAEWTFNVSTAKTLKYSLDYRLHQKVVSSEQMRQLWPRSFVSFNLYVNHCSRPSATWGGSAKAGHFSKSVQDTAHRVAIAVLGDFPNVEEVQSNNLHHHWQPVPART